MAQKPDLPAVYSSRYWSASGGLMSYGNVGADAFRQAAAYIDRILRGAKPRTFQYRHRSSSNL